MMVADVAVPAARPILTLDTLEGYDQGTHPSRTERRFCCPLPACADKPVDPAHRSLSLNTSSGEWFCHRCHAGGQLREHWAPFTPRASAQARSASLRRAFGLSVVPSSAPTIPANATLTPPVRTPDAPWRDQQIGAQPLAGTPGAFYLVQRGIPADLAAAAGVQYHPRWFGRPAVLFPMLDRRGELVAMHGRFLDDRNPRMRTAGEKQAGAFMMPDALLAEPLVVVEAPIDALSLAVAGVAAIAFCGTAWPEWLPKAAAFRAVYVATDADPAGDEAADKLTAALSFGSKVERLRPATDQGKDWNDALRAQGAERLRRRLFDRYAGPRYTAVYDRLSAILGVIHAPPPDVEAAIDAADWAAFNRELQAWEAAGYLAVNPPAPSPTVQMELGA